MNPQEIKEILERFRVTLETLPPFGHTAFEIVTHAGKISRVEVTRKEAFKIGGGEK